MASLTVEGQKAVILINHGECLPKMDSFRGKIDAYVVASLINRDTDEVIASWETEYVPHDYNPVWNHKYETIVPLSCTNPILKLELWDWDSPEKRQYGGCASLPLSSLTGGTRVPLQLVPKLKPHAGLTSFIHLICYYSSKHGSSIVATPERPGPIAKLTITVTSGANLPRMDVFRKIDGFVKLSVVDSISGVTLHRATTQVVTQNFDPVWNYSTEALIPLSTQKPRILLRLYDRDPHRSTFSGVATLPVAPIADQRVVLDLVPGRRPSRHASSADLVVTIASSSEIPAQWREPIASTSLAMQPKHRLGIKRLVTKPATAQRVHNVKHMDPQALDAHFNMVLIDDIYSQLDTGDILLFRGSELFSKSIRDATRSNWSHCAMIIRDPSPEMQQRYRVPEHRFEEGSNWTNPEEPERVFVFEAESETLLHSDVDGKDIQDGIQLVPIKYWMQRYNDECGSEYLLTWRKLARSDNSSAPAISSEQFEQLMAWVAKCASARYKQSKKQCYAAIFRLNTHEDPSSFFCSELVAATLAEIGVFPKKKRFASLLGRDRTNSTLANNTLPCDFSSEERHDGKDIRLNPPFFFQRERRIRLLSPDAQVDKGFFILTDIHRKIIREDYGMFQPYDVLISNRHFSSFAQTKDLQDYLSYGSEWKDLARSQGLIRPFFGLITQHPVLRIRSARLVGLHYIEREWFGKYHRESWEIISRLLIKTRTLSDKISRRSPWTSMVAKLSKGLSRGTPLEASVREEITQINSISDQAKTDATVGGDLAQERKYTRALERLFLKIFLARMIEVFGFDSETAHQLNSTAAIASVDALLALPEGPKMVSVLRGLYGMDDAQVLSLASSILSPNGMQVLLLKAHEQWSANVSQQISQHVHRTRSRSQLAQRAAFKNSVRKLAPLVGYICLQLLFVELQLDESINQSYLKADPLPPTPRELRKLEAASVTAGPSSSSF